jgi:hypothetical protein
MTIGDWDHSRVTRLHLGDGHCHRPGLPLVFSGSPQINEPMDAHSSELRGWKRLLPK